MTRQQLKTSPIDVSTAPATVRGIVEHGNEWGRVIGFPTANIVAPGLLAHAGIWAGIVRGASLPAEGVIAAVSVGTRPTYYGETGAALLEAHLLDFAADLYDQELSVELHVLLRAEVKFETTELLVEQLRIDVQNTRDWAATL